MEQKESFQKMIKSDRPIYQIANDIANDWKGSVHYTAKPYLSAMSCLDSINDRYGMDSAREIIARFLSNASTWRGETARRIKKELNQMLSR